MGGSAVLQHRTRVKFSHAAGSTTRYFQVGPPLDVGNWADGIFTWHWIMEHNRPSSATITGFITTAHAIIDPNNLQATNTGPLWDIAGFVNGGDDTWHKASSVLDEQADTSSPTGTPMDRYVYWFIEVTGANAGDVDLELEIFATLKRPA